MKSTVKNFISLRAICVICVLVFFAQLTIQHLTFVESWPLNQYLASVDRVESRVGGYYSSVESFLGTSSFYWPLSNYILHGFYKVSEFYAPYLMLLFFASLSVGLLFSLNKVAYLMGGNKLFASFLGIFYFSFVLNNWFSMLPNVLVLTFGIATYLITDQILNQKNVPKNIIFLFLVLFLGTLSKQQFVAFDVGIFLLMILNRSTPFRIKTAILATGVTSTSLSLLSIYLMPNAFFLTVFGMANHQMYGWHTLAHLAYEVIVNYWSLILPVLILLFINFKRGADKHSKIIHYFFYIAPYLVLLSLIHI